MAHVIKNHQGITDDKNSLIQIQIIGGLAGVFQITTIS